MIFPPAGGNGACTGVEPWADSAPLAFEYAPGWLTHAQRMALATLLRGHALGRHRGVTLAPLYDRACTRPYAGLSPEPLGRSHRGRLYKTRLDPTKGLVLPKLVPQQTLATFPSKTVGPW